MYWGKEKWQINLLVLGHQQLAGKWRFQNLDVINTLCGYLDCEVGEPYEYLKDEESNEKIGDA